jgi:light-regulated signal transduction histidine kinase (bacteriophytochrome)
VQGDAQLLSLVMENLIGNAFKYTLNQPRARIEIGMTQQKGERVYFVRDNGVGFDMAYYDKLFMPFQRLHSNEDFPGSGVGLATVQRIVERHGGRIWAEAIPDNGATFYMTLPS